MPLRARRHRRASRRSRLYRRRDLATALWMMDFLKRPLLLEGQAGVGKTEVAKALAAVHGAELIRLQCYEGLDQNAALYEWNYQRQLLAIKAREGARRSRRAHRRAYFLGEVSARAAAAGRDPPRQAAGSADRRGRSRRRGVRGVPARAAVRLPGHDPRARHDRRRDHPARRADLEQHARTLGRAAAALPLSLCRFSRRRARGGDHPRAHARRRHGARRADRAHGRGDPPRGSAQDAGRRRNARLGGDARRASASRICATSPRPSTTR